MPLEHSPRFDELSVALPQHIEQPILRQMTARLQQRLLGTADIPSHENETSDISHSAQILARLYQTPIADASILVAITNEARPRLLLTRRAGHLNNHAGEVSCAGGKHDAGDGNNVVTALREASEETALPASRVHIIGQLPPQESKKGLSVRPIVALIDADLVLVPELGEIARIFWADFEALLAAPTVEYTVPYTIGEQNMTLVTPSWQVDGETVWGLTGRVLASLMEIGFDREFDWYYRRPASARD
ncbi:NUDIX hydrolase [Psychrobacter aestuarii]|uniref:Nudix hydrolase domain-containing protein n=1 Tax=Psychrobacter aestuarii TaxID=556327 RepID=A0ABN0VTF2_9GAMM|nr:CoA pyrophosphatase [Psychrobacter aestuarii]